MNYLISCLNALKNYLIANAVLQHYTKAISISYVQKAVMRRFKLTQLAALN
jgi:hypothetical protein